MFQVTFAEFAGVMQQSASSVDAAEGHGCLCGALCTSGDYSIERWLEELIPDEARSMAEGDAEVLQLIFADTVQSLRGVEMTFEPLLPEEDESLERRAALMAQWARGFLYGFGIGGKLPAGAIPATVDEVLRDVAQIGGAAVDVGVAGEEEEAAYTEVFEYLRVSVQLVHDELQSARENHAAYGARTAPASNEDFDLPEHDHDDGRLSDDEHIH
jgi:uncharacterized protein YgfB (UPF0149 family)